MNGNRPTRRTNTNRIADSRRSARLHTGIERVGQSRHVDLPDWGTVMFWAVMPVVVVAVMSFPILTLAALSGMVVGFAGSEITTE